MVGDSDFALEEVVNFSCRLTLAVNGLKQLDSHEGDLRKNFAGEIDVQLKEWYTVQHLRMGGENHEFFERC